MPNPAFSALVDYEDSYVQPLILAALQTQLPPEVFTLLDPATSPLPTTAFLQFRSYETLDFTHALTGAPPQLINAYIIRKALIRKHYLAHTIHAWVTKHPSSPLKRHFAPAVDFELDYAEFLDEALLEAYELREAFARNEGKSLAEREWWILKPGMSDRGQGIRLFSTEAELTRIFEGWDDASEEEEDGDYEPGSSSSSSSDDDDEDDDDSSSTDNTPPKSTNTEGITTSHLRHFIAQPYIHPPLLIPTAPYNNRKFHIRTYVVAASALRVYVYSHMLALFASKAYTPPWEGMATEGENDGDGEEVLLQRMRDIHLTNTCIQPHSQSQSKSQSQFSQVEDKDSIHLLTSLPLPTTILESITAQINTIVEHLFRAAVAHPTNFQPLPQAFEIFGVDFLVSENGAAAESWEAAVDSSNGSKESSAKASTDSAADNPEENTADGDKEGEEKGPRVWLLEVNAFPDFGQTGLELREKVVGGLFGGVVREAVGPYFGVSATKDEEGCEEEEEGRGRLVKVLDVDMGRR